jgi:hypothetical protein
MFDHPAVCRALIGDLGRAGRMPELAGAIRNVFHAPVEQLLEEGEADGSLRRLSNRSGAASAVFGAVTIAGLEILVMAADTTTPESTATSILSVLVDGIGAASQPGKSATRPRRTAPRKASR